MKSSYGAMISIGACFFLLFSSTLFASSLRISWNNNTEWDLAGYKIYYGSVSGAYGYVLDVGNNVCVEITDVQEDTLYFLSVTAYDNAGNESDFSREVCVYIHRDLLGRLFSMVDGILDFLGIGQDEGVDTCQRSFADFSETEGYLPVSTTNVVQIDDSDVGYLEEFINGAYIIKDVILDADAPLDLATIYPAGTYTFVSLSERVPEIVAGMVYATEPGAYLFMVQDFAGEFVNILRISVVNTFCDTAEYLPGTETFLDIISAGISLFLPESALNSSVPVGIDCGGASSYAMSALSVRESYRVVFDIVPYGLVLTEPAEISVLYEGVGPVVAEVFDEATKQWVELSDVYLHDGVVTFSTTMLGSFKVYTPPPDTSNTGFSYESSSGGGGCFIESVQGIQATSGAYIFIAMIVLASTLCGASLRKRP